MATGSCWIKGVLLAVDQLGCAAPADSCDVLEGTLCFGTVILNTLFDGGSSGTFNFNNILSYDYSAIGMTGASPFTFDSSVQASAEAYCS